MKAVTTFAVVLSFLLPAWAYAATCPDRAPAAITSVGSAALKCQKTISKSGVKFIGKKAKGLAKCRQKEATGTCPDAKTQSKIDGAVSKAEEKIAKDCGDDAAQAALTSSYASSTDDALITSCMLSQHNLVGELVVANSSGLSFEDFPGQDNKARTKCAKEVSSSGAKYVEKALKNAAKCIDKQMKDGAVGDLVPVCVGQYVAGSFVAPSDAKTASKQSDLVTKIDGKVAKKCDDAGGYIPSLFACHGATTVADLQECLICQGWGSVLDLLEQQYSESATLVSNDPNAIQTAVDAASVGEKLLIASGTYEEDVVVTTDGLQIVGCGGAKDDRPLVVPPTGASGNGFFAAGIDNLVFQSLELFDWDDNGLLIADANSVTFRDIVADGNLNSEYGVFPVTSQGVLVEASYVTRVDDAGIYVGSCTDIIVRHNTVDFNVAAIEIENCDDSVVHNNHATQNTAGILVFKDSGVALQLDNNHLVSHNVVDDNNTANFATGGLVSVVPDGTGMLNISIDNSTWEYNFVRGNGSFGYALVDQPIINILGDPNDPVFPILSADHDAANNLIENNVFTGNGLSPDETPPNATPLAGDILYVLDAEDPNGPNCFQDNTTSGDLDLFLNTPQCP